MSFKDAKTALNQMVLEVLTAQGLEGDTQWENREFNPQGKVMWTSVEVFTDTPNVVTLGKGGSDRMVGYVSIMYSTATNKGTGELDDLVTQARQLFPAGKSEVVNGTKVIITGVGSEAGSTVDSWFIRPLNIFYRTDLTRATF